MKVIRTWKCPWTRKLVKTNNCFLSFYTMQLLKNIAFLTIFTFFPLIHNLIYNLPDLHPHCSTKNKLFLVMKWNEHSLALISLDISAAFDTDSHSFLKPCRSIRLHGFKWFWLFSALHLFFLRILSSSPIPLLLS